MSNDELLKTVKAKAEKWLDSNMTRKHAKP